MRQTDFSNDEAVGYLADRLARLGVDAELTRLGAEAGDEVVVGSEADGVVFDWEPSLQAGVEHRLGRRGRSAPGGAGPMTGRRSAATSLLPDGSSSRRLVVATTTAGGLDGDRVDALVDVLAGRRSAGVEIVLVSSGAIAAGLAPLRLPRRPRDLATQQASASVGQGLLLARYSSAFARHGLTVGQVLLTADDVIRRSHYRNAHRTLRTLLDLGWCLS